MRKVKVNQVRDLKSEITLELVSDLNQRFNKYGVYVESSTVTNVIVPKDLRIALQQATTYDVFLQNQVRIQGKESLLTHSLILLFRLQSLQL